MKLSDTNYFKKQDSLKSQNKNAEFSLLNQLKRKNFSKYTSFSLLYFFIYYLISKYCRTFTGKSLLKMSLNICGVKKIPCCLCPRQNLTVLFTTICYVYQHNYRFENDNWDIIILNYLIYYFYYCHLYDATIKIYLNHSIYLFHI